MTKDEFAQRDIVQRYNCLQEKGIKLITFQDPAYLIHLYSLGSFFVELRFDPVRYRVVSVEPFDESHPRYHQYMEKIDSLTI